MRMLNNVFAFVYGQVFLVHLEKDIITNKALLLFRLFNSQQPLLGIFYPKLRGPIQSINR